MYVLALLATTSCGNYQQSAATDKSIMNYASEPYAMLAQQNTKCATGMSISGGLSAKCTAN